MDLIELTKKELERGFTKSELERLWFLPKNSLSAILNPDLKVDFSRKAKIRVMDYFKKDLKDRPEPSPKIQKGRKPKVSASAPKGEYDDRSSPLINAARGRDESGINEDEIKEYKGVLDNYKKDEIAWSDNISFKNPKPQMPKGLSLEQQLQWKIDNL